MGSLKFNEPVSIEVRSVQASGDVQVWEIPVARLVGGAGHGYDMEITFEVIGQNTLRVEEGPFTRAARQLYESVYGDSWGELAEYGRNAWRARAQDAHDIIAAGSGNNEEE